MRTFKIITLFLILAFTIVFFIENMDPVPLYFPILKGCKFGLIFIMLGSYLLGAVTAFGVVTRIGARIKRERRLEERAEEYAELFDEE